MELQIFFLIFLLIKTILSTVVNILTVLTSTTLITILTIFTTLQIHYSTNKPMRTLLTYKKILNMLLHDTQYLEFQANKKLHVS